MKKKSSDVSKRLEHRRLIRRLIYSIPRNDFIYRICNRYVAYYNGQQDSDMFTNGEIYKPKEPEIVIIRKRT